MAILPSDSRQRGARTLGILWALGHAAARRSRTGDGQAVMQRERDVDVLRGLASS